MEMYLVGGIVRDMLLGLKPKDYDFTVVLPPDTTASFHYMRWMLKKRGVEIFVETPEFLTIRGRFAKDDPEYPGIAGDFVLARSDSATSDGRRPDSVTPGSLAEDLARRDFTVNAMALEEGSVIENGILVKGKIIDYFGGQDDLNNKLLRFVGKPEDRIREDALRVMRAIRFVVTKGFTMTDDTWAAVCGFKVPEMLAKISEERRADELSRMFRFDTEASLDILHKIPRNLRKAMFSGRVRLDSTLKD